MPIEPWWETNPATTPRQELGMVSPELRQSDPARKAISISSFGRSIIFPSRFMSASRSLSLTRMEKSFREQGRSWL